MTIELSTTRIMAALRSVKVAVVLIAYLAVTAALATLVPQGQEAQYYRQLYSPFAADLVLGLRIDVFFRSAIFLAPAGLFSVNLFLCTLHRLTSAHAGAHPKPWGPDLVHMGLLLLIVGGAITVFGREERMLYLPEGHSATLPDGSVLTVNSIQYQEYPDGRPRDYLTAVTVAPEGGPSRTATIEVNRPLRQAGRRIYQTNYYAGHTLTLEKDNQSFMVVPGDGVQTSTGTVLRFDRVDALGTSGSGDGFIVFGEYASDGSLTGERQFVVGDQVEGYQITGVAPFVETGLNVVRDPGFIPVLVALAMVTLGLSLTFIEKGLKGTGPAHGAPSEPVAGDKGVS